MVKANTGTIEINHIGKIYRDVQSGKEYKLTDKFRSTILPQDTNLFCNGFLGLYSKNVIHLNKGVPILGTCS